MTLLNEGLNRTRDLIHDDIDKGQLGTGGTASTPDDTSLETEDATTLLAITKTKSDKTIKFDYTLVSTGGTTTTYKEFELQKSSIPTHYDRTVFTGISFVNNGTKDLIISKKYFIRSV